MQRRNDFKATSGPGKGLAPSVGHRASWRTFRRDRRGASAVIVGVALPVIVGFMGLGVEVGLWFMSHDKLQSSVDMSAWAGAMVMAEGGTDTEITTAAEEEAARNGYDTTIGAIAVTIPSPTRPDSVEVIASHDLDLLFVSLFMAGPVKVEVRAVAETVPDSYCILELLPNDSSGIDFSGGASMDMDCGIAAQSTDSSAMTISGDTMLDTPAICIAGQTVISGTPSLPSAQPVDNCDPPEDPLRNLAAPTQASDPCTFTNWRQPNDAEIVTLVPGVYCDGIHITGANNTVVFEPGLYILAGQGLMVSGNSNVITGDGVMFYNTDNAGDASYGDVLFTGGSSEINLTAPTPETNGSGSAYVDPAYHGVVFFGDRAMGDQSFRTVGDVVTNFDGAVYWPSGTISHAGRSSNTHTCTGKMIADRFDFAGASDNYYQGGDCAVDHVNISNLARRVSLVE